MAHEEEKPKAFKVDDRRRFSSEGELKPEFREGEEAKPAHEAKPAAATAAREVPPAAGEHHQHHEHHPEQHAGGPPHGHQGEHHQHAGKAAEITFGTFLVSLSTQALMHLGDIPDPQSGRPEQDLVGAQQLIDIIGMLEQKTRGNLDRDEAQLIEAILYELRMKYVERARPIR